jgi:hypothetical protein
MEAVHLAKQSDDFHSTVFDRTRARADDRKFGEIGESHGRNQHEVGVA